MKKMFLKWVCLCMVMVLMAGCSSNTEEDVKKGTKSSESSSTNKEENSIIEGTYDEDLECILAEGLCYEIKEDTYVAVIGYHDEEKESIQIPKTIIYEGKEYPVEGIGESAFSYQQVLREISFPDSLKIISKEAFCGCSSLETITIPDSVTTLGTGAFYDCSELTSCVISKEVTSIPNEIFTNCYALESVTLSNNLVAIGEEAFWACENLKEMVLPESVVSIGQRAFYGSGLQKLTIPSESINITENMLEGLDELQTLYVAGHLVDSFQECVNQEVQIKAFE